MAEGKETDSMKISYRVLRFLHGVRKASFEEICSHLKKQIVFKKRSLSALLNRLKTSGLINTQGPNRIAYWKLTDKGRIKLNQLEEEDFCSGNLKNHKASLVTFDVPEKESPKRVWLRHLLIKIGFKQLQRSVWVSRRFLNKHFFKILKTRGILKYVHYFSLPMTKKIDAIFRK